MIILVWFSLQNLWIIGKTNNAVNNEN